MDLQTPAVDRVPGKIAPGITLPRVLIASTAMLTFISFGRAAAIVLNDMGSSAFYAGAIAEHFIGKAAPWFILAIMLLAYAVRAVYIESCSMFVRGGVYRVVKEAMGPTLAKFSASALMFDYILTGPISGVSAGLYFVGLANELLLHAQAGIILPVNSSAAAFAILVTIYFWWQNIKGIPESSQKALRIMYVTTVMVALLLVWCCYTLWMRGFHLPPMPWPANLTFSADALGWLGRTQLAYSVGLISILVGLGHSVLAMSGEETMAQVYREIEHPKLRNLEKAGFVIFVYSLIFTAGVAFFAVMIIPDETRGQFFDNPIGGLAMNLAGPLALRLAFRVFVVVVGVLMLAGAVNTAIVGSNGVLNRVSEDGILPNWFRQPHPRFGTSYRILHLVAGLQVFAILVSRGDIFLLGEAYAFGVMWSFAMKALAVLVLRYKDPGRREFRVPLNLRIGQQEIPLGLAAITMTLFALCAVNFFTKQVATVSGVVFTLVFFAVFTLSERAARRQGSAHDLDQFHVAARAELSAAEVGCRPGSFLVPLSNHRSLHHLRSTLGRVKPERRDVVVLHVRLLRRASSGESASEPDQLFGRVEQHLFTQALALAEALGKPIRLVVVEAGDVWGGIVGVAAKIQSSAIILGASAKWNCAEQARQIGLAWEGLPDPRPNLSLEVHGHAGQREFFSLGPHAPHLTAFEIGLLHQMWLRLSNRVSPDELHHHDIVHFALEEVGAAMENASEAETIARLRGHLQKNRERHESRT